MGNTAYIEIQLGNLCLIKGSTFKSWLYQMITDYCLWELTIILLVKPRYGMTLFVDSHLLYVLRTWNCSEDQTKQFQVCNKYKTLESTKNIMPRFGLNNEIIDSSQRYQPVPTSFLEWRENSSIKITGTKENSPVFGKWDFFQTKYQQSYVFLIQNALAKKRAKSDYRLFNNNHIFDWELQKKVAKFFCWWCPFVVDTNQLHFDFWTLTLHTTEQCAKNFSKV